MLSVQPVKGLNVWLDLGFIRFQPSEIVKLAVPLMVAVYLGNRPLPPKMSETFIAIAMIIVPTLLVAIQPDLGTSILVSASGLFVVFLARDELVAYSCCGSWLSGIYSNHVDVFNA